LFRLALDVAEVLCEAISLVVASVAEAVCGAFLPICESDQERATHACIYARPAAAPPAPRARKKGGVTDGTRTRNNQNHNLELYH
jgi:hypothetical protein